MPKIEILESLNRVKIEVNSFFYPWESVEETLHEFESICEWEVEEDDGKIKIVLIVKSNINLEELGYEFMNHLLAKSKELVT